MAGASQIAELSEINRAISVFQDTGLALTAIFCAKEALFKCIAPQVGRYFDFLDVELINCTASTLSLRLRGELGAGHSSGQIYVAGLTQLRHLNQNDQFERHDQPEQPDHLIFTSVVLPP